jgi:hypothetical protein
MHHPTVVRSREKRKTVPNWRDELIEAVKTKAEREAEEAAKQRQRVLEALSSAETAVTMAVDALRFACERITEKGQPAVFTEEHEPAGDDAGKIKVARLALGSLGLSLELDRTTAIVRVGYLEGKPREFDFARDRHIAAADVEEYVGRRAVELVRSAQKAAAW